MRRSTSPIQQWVDSLPSPSENHANAGSALHQESVAGSTVIHNDLDRDYTLKQDYIKRPMMTISSPITVPNSPAISLTGVSKLARDPSFQSDSSHCSSVESLLELRRADPEAILLGLGFGGCSSSPQENGPLSRIPKRFLQPSKLKGIAITDFVKHEQETSESLDSTSLGYRGLTGSPYVAPSEIVQKIMQRLKEHESHETDAYTSYNNNFESYIASQQDGRLSVLSPDNRQYLERPRSKSPDMRNKRMIIGQRSFAFGTDGDLIEIKPSDEIALRKTSSTDSLENVENTELEGPTPYDNLRMSCDDLFPNSVRNFRTNSKEDSDSIDTIIPTHSNIDNDFNQREMSDEKHNPEDYNNSQRRASEGSCVNFPFDVLKQEDGRRFSDGIMHASSKNEMSPAERRKSFKRQARVTDSQLLESNELQQYAESLDTSLEARLKMDAVNANSIDDHSCCSCQTPEQDCYRDEESINCCYRSSSKKCWREMKRVLEKNKKLEDAVAKNKREMAELRNILSNVLSVRLEPGF